MENIERLSDLCKEIKTFLASRAHLVYRSNTERDLAVVEERILDDELESLKDFITLVDLRGQRKVLKANVTLFEDTLATLENRVQELLTKETQVPENNEKENER